MEEKESSEVDKYLEKTPSTKNPEQTSGNFSDSFPKDEKLMTKRQRFFSGPLPPPEILRSYNDVVPGSGERIMKIFEKQREHKMELEKNIFNRNFETARRGQYLGFAISIAGLIATGVIAVYSSAVTAGVIGTASLVSLVKLFLVDPLLKNKNNK